MIPLNAADFLVNSTQTQAIIALVVIALAFFIGSITDLHMGILVLSVLALVGPIMYHDSISTLQGGWNINLMFTLLGVTYLFALANNNGTVNWIVAQGMKLVGGRAQLFPFAMFVIVAILTAIGCATPAACAIMMPIALAFARQNNINPVAMSQAVIQGCSAGSFSPMGLYGIIIKGNIDSRQDALTAANNGFNHMIMWVLAIVIDLLIVIVCFMMYRGNAGPTEAEVAAAGRDESVDLEGSSEALVDEEFGDQSNAKSIDTEIKLNGERITTLCGIVLMAVVTILAAVLKVNVATTAADGTVTTVATKLSVYIDISWTSLLIAAVLTLLFPKAAKGAVMQVAWPTILLVCGIVTYVSMLEKHGVVNWIGNLAAGLGSPQITCIIIFFIAALVSAYASTTGLFPILIPIAAPFMVPSDPSKATSLVSATMLMAGLGISASTVDCSPFSTNGALGVANSAHQSEYTYKGLFKWSWILIVGTPIVCWLLFMLPPWGHFTSTPV